MALKDWDDVPYISGDCARDHNEWNDMIDYIKHKGSCDSGTGYILYDNDASTEQRFKFTYNGSDSIIEGHSNTLKHLIMKANSTDTCPYIKLLGDSDILNYIEDTSDFIVKTCSGTELLKVNDTEMTYKGAAIGGGCTDEGEIPFTLWTDCVGQTGERFKFQQYYINIEGIRSLWIKDDSTAVGKDTLIAITTGTDNTVYGKDSCKYMDTGYNNVTAGYLALPWASSAFENVILGHTAASALTVGDNNVMIGTRVFGSGRGLIVNSVLIGSEAGDSNFGDGAVAVGHQALFSNFGSGGMVTAVGFKALYSCDGEEHTALGYEALYNSSWGLGNTGLGHRALFTTTQGGRNTGCGARAGELATAAMSGCTYLGYSAGQNNTTADSLWINNNNSIYPLIYGDFANDIVQLGNNTSEFFLKFSWNGTDNIVESLPNNDDLYLKTNGTGVVKFGTYAAITTETLQGFVTIKDIGGTLRKVGIVA